MPSKQRLDILTTERGLVATRSKAQGMIMAGEVLVNGTVADKPGMKISTSAKISLKSKPRFVSRGGEKLAGALLDFDFDVTGRICADVGASTGGFTDCLLQNGAARIYAIDVGYGQIDYALRRDERVLVMERTNARYVEKLDEQVNLVVVDASFISLKILLPVIKNWLMPQADLLTLIKPQFEAGKGEVGKGGVVRDVDVHIRVLEDITAFASNHDFTVAGLTLSKLKGPAGNIEFLAWLSWGGDVDEIDITTQIRQLISEE
jgi:23S rRNA (cytidine1920-2'-O)/16S rRNA (cytidine1409-2'-O)-methyltransferase